MTDWMSGGELGNALTLDALLHVLEAMPGVETAWDLDCLRTALRVARATEAPDDLARATLAYGALIPESRARLLEHVTAVAHDHQRRTTPAVRPVERRPGRLVVLLSSLMGRPATADSGVTAKDRLLRDRISARGADA